MRQYQLLDNNKPADTHHHSVHRTWNKSCFNSFDEAVDYAIKWLGWDRTSWWSEEDGQLTKASLMKDLENEKKYDYSGYGDTIQIVVVDVDTKST